MFRDRSVLRETETVLVEPHGLPILESADPQSKARAGTGVAASRVSVLAASRRGKEDLGAAVVHQEPLRSEDPHSVALRRRYHCQDGRRRRRRRQQRQRRRRRQLTGTTATAQGPGAERGPDLPGNPQATGDSRQREETCSDSRDLCLKGILRGCLSLFGIASFRRSWAVATAGSSGSLGSEAEDFRRLRSDGNGVIHYVRSHVPWI